MEKRFQPDLAVRLSADNVEKHRDRISQLLETVRNKDKRFKADAENRLRELLPELAKPGMSVLWTILDGIDTRIRNASDVMLPALRRALQGFTKRADIIIRQMSYLASQQQNDVLSVCKKLAAMSGEEQNEHLLKAGQLMSVPDIELVDPASVRLAPPRRRREIEAALDENTEEFDIEARKDIYVQQVLDQAFFINNQSLRNYVYRHLTDGKIVNTRDLPIQSAPDFLAVAHSIGVAASSNMSSEFEVMMSYDPDAGHDDDNGYFEHKDHFRIELVRKDQTDNKNAVAQAE
jgi:hypothetical protein